MISRPDYECLKFLELKRILEIVRYTFSFLPFFVVKNIPTCLEQGKYTTTKHNDQLSEKSRYFLA